MGLENRFVSAYLINRYLTLEEWFVKFPTIDRRAVVNIYDLYHQEAQAGNLIDSCIQGELQIISLGTYRQGWDY